MPPATSLDCRTWDLGARRLRHHFGARGHLGAVQDTTVRPWREARNLQLVRPLRLQATLVSGLYHDCSEGDGVTLMRSLAE